MLDPIITIPIVVALLVYVFSAFRVLDCIDSHTIKDFKRKNQRWFYAEIITLPLASLLALRMVNLVVDFLFAPECRRCWFEYCTSGLDLRDGLELMTLDFLLTFCCLASWVTLTLASVSKFQSTIVNKNYVYGINRCFCLNYDVYWGL